MPWIDALSEPQQLRRCIRDLVALSTLPAIWKDYTPGESHRLLLGIAANDATAALQRWQADASQRRIVALIERSSDFVGLQSLDGGQQYLNAAGCELVGFSSLEEAKKANVFEFVAPHDQTRARHEVFPQVVNEGRWMGEIRFRDVKNGEIFPLILDWFRIDDLRTGRPMNLAAVGRDLRAQKRLEAELRRLNELLERRVAKRTTELAEAIERLTIEAAERGRADAKAQELQLELFHSSRLSAAGQVTGAIAHELNQPLTAFANSVNAARRLMANGTTDRIDTARSVLDEAAEQVLRAGEIVRRLRELITRGETEMCVESLPALIRAASDLASAGAGTNATQVHMHFDPRAELVLGNRVQLQQVTFNLLRNALEATAQSERRELQLATNRIDSELIEIVVADRGPGLPDEIAQHLFEPFRTTKRNGMGLGLSICRTIVEAHGGRLQYERNTGGGALFRVTLPVALAA